MSPGPRAVARIMVAARRGSKRRVPFAAVQIPPRAAGLRLTGARMIDRLHAMGLQVHVWTINTEQEMHALLDAGVDAIMTDEVSLLRKVLNERGHWSHDH